LSHSALPAVRRQLCVAGGDAAQIESSRAKGAGTARPELVVRRGLEVDSRRDVGQSWSTEMHMATESWYVWPKS